MPAPSAHERAAYIDTIVDETQQTLSDPEVIAVLNGYAEVYGNMLDAAVVANVREGQVDVPTGTEIDESTVIFAAVSRSEQLATAGYFGTQTPVQRDNTLSQFKLWGMRYNPVDTLEHFSPRHTDNGVEPFTVHDSSRALNLTRSLLMTERTKRAVFERAPDALVGIMYRPLIILPMEQQVHPLGPSEIVHELAHFLLEEDEPILQARSQRALDMHALRAELTASAPGAAVAKIRLQQTGRASVEGVQTDTALMQIMFDVVRLDYAAQYGVDPSDPYKPTGMLLKKIQEAGLSNALHLALNYDELCAKLAEVEAREGLQQRDEKSTTEAK